MTNSGCEHLHGTLTRVNVSPLRRAEQGTLTNRLRAPGLMLDTQSSQRFGSIDTRIDEIENNWIRMYVVMFLLWTKIKVRFDKNFYRCHKSLRDKLTIFSSTIYRNWNLTIFAFRNFDLLLFQHPFATSHHQPVFEVTEEDRYRRSGKTENFYHVQQQHQLSFTN